MSLKTIDPNQVTYYDLNNEINLPLNGQIQLGKDKEALAAFLKENVIPNTMKFNSLKERFDYLIANDYLESEFLAKYDFAFIEKLYAKLTAANFTFKTFMAAYKFYAQYALKTNDGAYYLESFIDRVAINALYICGGTDQAAFRAETADFQANPAGQPPQRAEGHP